jgi:hypothetical protein
MIKCRWCDKDSAIKTYRTVDTITGSSIECIDCNNLGTKYLIARRYKNDYHDNNL